MKELPLFHGRIDYSEQNSQLINVKAPWAYRFLLLTILDFFAIIIVPAIACFFTSEQGNLQKNALFWDVLAVIAVLLVISHGGYRQDTLQNRYKTVELAIRCYLATSVTMLLAALLLGHEHAVSRYWTTAELCLTPIFLTLVRTMPVSRIIWPADQVVANGPVVICFDKHPCDLNKALAEQQISSCISGILYLCPGFSGTESLGWPVIPDIQGLLEMLRAKSVGDIIFIYQPELEAISAMARQDLLSQLLIYPARIWLAFDLRPQLPSMLANRSGHYKLVPIVTDTLVHSLNMTKRLFDVFVSGVLLVLALPILAFIAALVRLSGPGPVVFRQIRTGAHGHRFTVLKFRTMSHAADAGFVQAKPDDLRVTRIGRFLRRRSLDELLQLINVLKGDMSLVGPRPHAPETQVEGITFEDAVKLYRLRHRVKPGITGLAQIRGQRGETAIIESLEQRISSDLEYIETWSIWLDVAILFRTVTVVISPKNAH